MYVILDQYLFSLCLHKNITLTNRTFNNAGIKNLVDAINKCEWKLLQIPRYTHFTKTPKYYDATDLVRDYIEDLHLCNNKYQNENYRQISKYTNLKAIKMKLEKCEGSSLDICDISKTVKATLKSVSAIFSNTSTA